MDNFFSHENQAAPSTLSTEGKIRLGVKADLLRCLGSDLLEENVKIHPDATILDGAAVVQMLNPGASRTFQEYMEKVCLHHTYLLNLREATELTLSGIYIDPPA